MKKTTLVLALLSISLLPAMATAMPTAGSNELRIDSTYLMPGYSITGFNHYSMSSGGQTDSMSLLGFGFAYGHFLTNEVEIGTSLTFLYMGSDGDSVMAPGLSPFLRGFFPVAPTTAFYAAAVVGFQHATESRSGGSDMNNTLLSAGVDLGLEFFLADSWSLRVGPTYRYVHESMSMGSTSVSGSEQIIGLNWAIAGYF
jgi:hypothetical protein